MALNSLGYLIIFPIILILYYILPSKARVYLLTAVSLALYSLWDIRYTCILLFLAFFTWSGGSFIDKNMGKKGICRFALWINVFFIAGILGSIRLLPRESIIAPIGISFYSLQAIGYVADVYNGKVKSEKSLIRYILFLAFFPVVTSGPIQRSDGLLTMLREERQFDYDKVRSGLYMIAYGLFAKNFVADRLEYIVSKAYDGYATETGFILLIGVVTYAFQLYCDFMGYSYIALGSAKALGFELSENFRRPYFSTSVKEFWSRWHISLSTWLRDYIYYPLGGSRKGKFRTVINIAIVFLISGIWHGRGLTFIVWGALHGLYRIIEVFTLKKRDDFIERRGKSAGGILLKGIFGIITFIAVDFAWLFFRAESLSSALEIVKKIFFGNLPLYSIRMGFYTFGRSRKELLFWFAGLLIVLVVDILQENGIYIGEWLAKRKLVIRWLFYIVFICFMMGTTIYYYGYSASTFIYSGF